jgi:integrase
MRAARSALVEAAPETGCRRREFLSLQWRQVRFTLKAEIFLPGQKTKTKTDRTVRISSRLKVILEMPRNGPDGEELSPQAHVFGNECGDPSKASNGERAVLKAHGVKPRYVVKVEGEGA